jgi:tRNA A-37 threonylcarbamoyl transferase component Bud32
MDFLLNDDFDGEILIRYGQRDPDRPDEVLAQYDQLSSSLVIRYLIFEFFPDLFAAACFLYLFNISQFWAHQFGSKVHLAVIYIQLSLMFATVLAFLILTLLYIRSFKLNHMLLPSDLGLSSLGIRLHRRNLHIGGQERLIAWDDITSVRIVQNESDKAGQSSEPVLEIQSVGLRQPLRLKLSMIASIEERHILYGLLKRFARRAIGENDISGLVRMNNLCDIPFTQLWSQALMDRRARIRTSILPPDTTLQAGRFCIKENVGGGGQGAVYLAEMLEGGEPPESVILKEYVLPEREHASDYKKAIEQFEKEIRLMSKMTGVKIAKLIDAFVEDRRSYLVLEKIDGISLKQYVERHGALDSAQVVNLAKQMCEILQQLHSMSPPVMHLDFSPENLMLTQSGDLVLIDFNISSEQDSLRTKTVMGKQHYMAPEQYRGSPSLVSDIYSCGATMYFLLTGQEPEPISVSRPALVNAQVDRQLNEITARATMLEEKERFADAQSILQALSDITLQESVAMPRTSRILLKETETA